ncbi:hypothetical protein GGF50DRAFT_106023, partial [Schizophyllum commune]
TLFWNRGTSLRQVFAQSRESSSSLRHTKRKRRALSSSSHLLDSRHHELETRSLNDDSGIEPVVSTASSDPVVPNRGKIADDLVSNAPAFPPERRARAQRENIPLPTYDIAYTSFPARKHTPSQAEELDGWCEALVDLVTERFIHATFLARPSVVLPRNKTPAYRIAPAEGKGLGMFAARDLQTGDLILAERPLIMAPVRLPPSPEDFPDGMPISVTKRELSQAQFNSLERYLKTLLERMPPERSSAYRALKNIHEGDGRGPLVGRFRTNGLAVSEKYAYRGMPKFPGDLFSVVMDEISRVNHSCRPNAYWHFDTDLFAMFLRPYAGLGTLYKERKSVLASYGFGCTCKSCLDPVASDARLLEIDAFSRVQDPLAGDPSTALKTTLGRIALMRTEGAEGLRYYYILYVALEMLFRLTGNHARADGARKEIVQISWALFNKPRPN